MRTFTLDNKQEKKFKEWQNAIKVIHGKYGHFRFTFSPYGIGTGVEVYSDLLDKTLDLSFPEDW